MKRRKAILEKDLVVGRTYFDTDMEDGVAMVLIEVSNDCIYFKMKDGNARPEYTADELGIMGFSKSDCEWYLPNKNEQ